MHYYARRTGSALAILMLAGVVAMAQSTATIRITGVVEAIGGQSITVDTLEQKSEIIELPPDSAIDIMQHAELKDIRQGDFVGSATDTLPDGTMLAIEVHIFPAAQRGFGEGFTPNFAEIRDGSGTNVMATSPDDQILTLDYPGGEKIVHVSRDTPIVRFISGNRTDIAVGSQVSLTAMRGADGVLHAINLQVSGDGAMLPF